MTMTSTLLLSAEIIGVNKQWKLHPHGWCASGWTHGERIDDEYVGRIMYNAVITLSITTIDDGPGSPFLLGKNGD